MGHGMEHETPDDGAEIEVPFSVEGVINIIAVGLSDGEKTDIGSMFGFLDNCVALMVFTYFTDPSNETDIRIHMAEMTDHVLAKVAEARAEVERLSDEAKARMN